MDRTGSDGTTPGVAWTMRRIIGSSETGRLVSQAFSEDVVLPASASLSYTLQP